MSDTPRTDEEQIDWGDMFDDGVGKSPYVYADFARQIERELAACRQLLGLVMEQPTNMQVALDNAKKDAWVRAEELATVKAELDAQVRLAAWRSEQIERTELELAEMIAERDELREALERYRGQVDCHGHHSAAAAIDAAKAQPDPMDGFHPDERS